MQWNTWNMSGVSPIPGLCGIGRTVEFKHCAVGYLGYVQDVPGLYVGLEGQLDSSTAQWDTWDISGMSLIPGLYVGFEGQWNSSTVQWDTRDRFRMS